MARQVTFQQAVPRIQDWLYASHMTFQTISLILLSTCWKMICGFHAWPLGPGPSAGVVL